MNRYTMQMQHSVAQVQETLSLLHHLLYHVAFVSLQFITLGISMVFAFTSNTNILVIQEMTTIW